jgi:hypothetical protein
VIALAWTIFDLDRVVDILSPLRPGEFRAKVFGPFRILGQMFFSGLGVALIRKGSQIAAISAREALASDSRPPVVLLRSFVDDEIVLEIPGYGKKFFPGKTFLEEVLVSELSKVGPVIAIGRPGDTIAPIGAAREYVGDDSWTSVIAEWIGAARTVVMVIGSIDVHKGLAWELGEVVRIAGIDKLLLVIPPDDHTAARRWALYSDALGIVLPQFSGAERFVSFDKDGNPKIALAPSPGATSQAPAARESNDWLDDFVPRFEDYLPMVWGYMSRGLWRFFFDYGDEKSKEYTVLLKKILEEQ